MTSSAPPSLPDDDPNHELQLSGDRNFALHGEITMLILLLLFAIFILFLLLFLCIKRSRSNLQNWDSCEEHDSTKNFPCAVFQRGKCLHQNREHRPPIHESAV
ncbi:hypothetical protein SLEP1_g31950 [Rubroshorea leprosula]|uniref:Uncharacterized protein n=1 Tax=Rubroshorea leprosula TaxID=152421 RepID=A0AAV5KBV6_9ROSI|nr:hypothetical protein SLEP1_g31950 [Rubroshorea leprosula]